MRVPQGQVQILSLHRGAITDADDGHAFLKTLGHAQHHVVHKRARGAGHGVGKGRVVVGGNVDQLALVGQLDLRVDIDLEAALRPLDAEQAVVQLDLDTARYSHRIFGNS